MSGNQSNNYNNNPNNNNSGRRTVYSHNYTQVDPDHWYTEEERRPDNRTWEEYNRSVDQSRDTTADYVRTNLEELVAGDNNFIGIEEYHPVPNRVRYLEERYYRTETVPRGRTNDLLSNPIRTIITLYPRGFPVFEFTDPVTNRQSYAAYPSARDQRLDRNTRIILQALEISLQDPDPSEWEEYYHGA